MTDILKRLSLIGVLAVVIGGLAACGDTLGEQALGGAAIGAEDKASVLRRAASGGFGC